MLLPPTIISSRASTVTLILSVIIILTASKHNVAQVPCENCISGQSPIAVPGGPYVGMTGQAIALNGNDSSSLDGSIIYYYWDSGG